MTPVKLSDVLDAISDDDALELLKLVAITGGSSSEVLRSRMTITRKQYYSRLFKLTRCGAVKKTDNVYSLTMLGKALYDAQAAIESALGNYWKIRAVDSIEVVDGIPVEEQNKLIETLLGNQEIKNVLIKR
jgi:predicted transcriptional regulator